MKYILLIFSFLVIGNGISQLEFEQYFHDSLTGKLNYIYNHIEVDDVIIVSGEITQQGKDHPVIIKIAPDGSVLWSTFNAIQVGVQYSTSRSFNIWLFDDGYIYGMSKLANPNLHHIWKLNPLNGAIEYVNVFPNTSPKDISLVEYNDSKLIAVYTAVGSQSKSLISTLNKMNGSIISTMNMGDYNGLNHGARVDKARNVYYWKDNVLAKFNKDDFTLKLWERDFNNLAYPIDDIQNIYLDKSDKLFVFGNDPNPQPQRYSRIAKVELNRGEVVWNSEIPTFYDVGVQNIIDRNGKLFLSYRHLTVGGSPSWWRTCRLDKLSGNIDWYSSILATTVGIPTSHNGGHQGIISMDLDCSAGLYLTGYYGSANYGPGNWAVMKLDATNGSKIYDFTIKEDTVNFDFLSTGKVLCLFQDSPVVLGQIENLNSPYFIPSDAYYASFDPSNGTVLDKHRLGGNYMLPSKTIDVQNSNDTIFAYKQQGSYASLEAFDSNMNSIWTRSIMSEALVVHADQMAITDNFIYLTSHINYGTINYPFDNGQCYRMLCHKIDRNTGLTIDSVLINGNNSIVDMLELEAEDNAAFIFYSMNGTGMVRRWSSSIVSPSVTVNLSAGNGMYDGEINNVLNYSPSSLLVIRTSGIFEIQKANLSQSVQLLPFVDTRVYYDLSLKNDKLYLVGQLSNSNCLVSSYSVVQNNFDWNQTYGTGSFYKIVPDPYGNFVVAGDLDTVMSCAMIYANNGDLVWQYYVDSISMPKTHLYDLHVNEQANSITITGSNLLSIENSNVIMSTLNYYGDTILTFQGVDAQNLESCGYILESAPDSTTLIGGAHNRLLTLKEGFINSFDTPFCSRFITGDLTICSGSSAELIAWQGTSYQWYRNGLELSGETSQYLYPTQAGLYNVIVSDACGSDSVVVPYELLLQPVPIVNFDYNQDTVCENSGIHDLSSFVTPVGGTFSGSGVIGNYFDPSSAASQSTSILEYTIVNQFGCSASAIDSIFIGAVSDTIINMVVCDSFSLNGFTYNVSGSYIQNFTNIVGCDSIIEINLTINGNISAITKVACNNYITPSGAVYNSSGVYYDTIPNSLGCDSIIEINLTINNNSTNSIFETSCTNFISPSGIVYNSSGIYYDTIPNSLGCDSIIEINLTINNSSTNSIFETSCTNFMAPSGIIYNSSGIYYDTIPNNLGCDSIIEMNITITESSTSALTEFSCGPYTAPSGSIFNSTGVFNDTIPNAAMCDSIITIDLTVVNVDTGVSNNGGSLTITSTSTSGSFQWLDCNDNFSEISGETNQSYTALINGSYAVIVTDNSCSDTSVCTIINSVGLNTIEYNTSLVVYPNPSTGIYFVKLDKFVDVINISIYDLLGRLIDTDVILNADNFEIEIDSEPGVYHLYIEIDKGEIQFIPLIKE